MKKYSIILLIMILVLSIASTVSANANIIFNPRNVKFVDSNTLAISGDIVNNGDKNGILDNVHLEVYQIYGNGPFLLASYNFNGLNGFVPAGAVIPWSFAIPGVNYTEIGKWRVVSDLDFHW